MITHSIKKIFKINIKRVSTNVSTKEKLKYRCRKKTYCCQEVRGGEGSKLGDWD